MPTSRPVVRRALIGAVALIPAVAAQTAAHAAAPSYVALGDSYSSGTGVDAAIRPESFQAPTVDSLRAPAERAGIDLDRWLTRH